MGDTGSCVHARYRFSIVPFVERVRAQASRVTDPPRRSWHDVSEATGGDEPDMVKATIDDVARRAQVSVATVSRALRGLPNVAPSTRARVIEAARDLQYVADPSAAQLASGRRLVIGLVTPMIGQWFYGKLYTGVEAVAATEGYEVLPYSLSGPGGVEGFLRDLPFRKRVDGIIVVDAPITAGQLDRITATQVATVTVGFSAPHVSSLQIDNVGAAQQAVEHLIGLGHQRIALIGAYGDDPFMFSVPSDRFDGYLRALEGADLDHDPALVVAGNFSLEGGAEAMAALLALDEPPTAVFACSDEMAMGAMHVVRRAGMRVPDDVSVVGFDDHDVAAYVGLTTVRQDVVAMGERATRLLFDQVKSASREPAHERHETQLVVRESTMAPERLEMIDVR